MCEIKRPRRPLIHVEAGERRRYRISARPAVSLFAPPTTTTTFPLFCFPLGGVERQPDSLPLLPGRRPLVSKHASVWREELWLYLFTWRE